MKDFIMKAALIGFYLTALYAVIGETIIWFVHPASVWFRWSVVGAFIAAPILMGLFISMVNRWC